MGKFLMLVGISGSGKTTFAKRVQDENPGDRYVVLSSDDIREELYGDASVQKDHAKVFEIMMQRTLEHLEKGNSVIYDATNLYRENRMNVVKKIRNVVDCEMICVYCPVLVSESIRRQDLRDRKVPDEVIRRQHKSIQPISYEEGWNKICTANNFKEVNYGH